MQLLRRAVASVGTFALSTVLVAASAGVAAADSSGWKSNTDTYSKTAWQYVESKSACLKVTASGNIKYRAKHDWGLLGGVTDAWTVDRITFSKLKVKAAMYKYDPGNHACTDSRLKVKKLQATGRLRGYSCSYNPSISVSAPWGVGVSFWPSCDDKKAAYLSEKLSNTSSVEVYDEDGRVKFPKQVVFNQGAKPGFRCYGFRTTVRITTGKSTTVKTTPRQRICLSPQY